VVLVIDKVGLCGSRAVPLSATDSALVSGVLGSVLAALPRRDVAVGCADSADALVVSSVLPQAPLIPATYLCRKATP
jgi:hypothetical protein